MSFSQTAPTHTHIHTTPSLNVNKQNCKHTLNPLILHTQKQTHTRTQQTCVFQKVLFYFFYSINNYFIINNNVVCAARVCVLYVYTQFIIIIIQNNNKQQQKIIYKQNTLRLAVFF